VVIALAAGYSVGSESAVAMRGPGSKAPVAIRSSALAASSRRFLHSSSSSCWPSPLFLEGALQIPSRETCR